MVLQAGGGNKGYNLLIRVVAVVFVYSTKPDDDFSTYRVLARFTSLLFTLRTFTVATAYKKVSMITSTIF